MKIEIEVPSDKEIDWEESSKQKKIVLKDKELTYKDICEKMFKNGAKYINNFGRTNYQCVFSVNDTYFNMACTQKQLECILAKNALANVAVYLNNGWKPNLSENFTVYTPYYDNNIDALVVDNENAIYARNKGHIIFKSEELVHQAFNILGEDIIKLALTPLGI